MATLTPVEKRVLDTTAHGPENLEGIYRRLHASPSPVPLADTVEAVRSLLEKGLLRPESESEPAPPDEAGVVWKARLATTFEGRDVSTSEPAETSAWPKGVRAYAGMFKGLIPDFTAEEINQARREMWGNFPREFPE